MICAGPRSYHRKSAPKLNQYSAEWKPDVPTPSVSHGLALPDGLFAGEQVRMLSVDDVQIISAAHLHLIRFLLEQDLAAQLVKHDGVHCWPDIVFRLYFSVVQKSQKHFTGSSQDLGLSPVEQMWMLLKRSRRNVRCRGWSWTKI